VNEVVTEQVTEVAFHFGAPNKLAYVCRLLRKAVGAGARVVVLGDDAQLQRLDLDLWAVSPTDFLPHTLVGAAAPSTGRGDERNPHDRNPIVLTPAIAMTQAPREVLVNLTDQVPQEFAQFARVIEVVGLDDTDRAEARLRWKRYTELGYTIARHDLALRS